MNHILLNDPHNLEFEISIKVNDEIELLFNINYVEWWDEEYKCKEWFQYGEPHRLDGPAVVWNDGDKEWWQYGEPHRLDGPAMVWANGTEAWCQYDKYHRLDGPAYIDANGYKEWLQDDRLHRLDGPAVVDSDGSEEYWIEGERLTKEEFMERTQKIEV